MKPRSLFSIPLLLGAVLPLSAQDGGQLYGYYCAACHADNGEGATAGVFPPLAGSEWLSGEPDRAIKIVLHGMQGPVEVAGKSYNLVMPPQGQVLSDANLAAILTYVRTAWGNDEDVVAPDRVAKVRAATAARNEPWTAEQLRELHPLPKAEPSLEKLTSRLYHGKWQNLPEFDALEAVAETEHPDGVIRIDHVERGDHFGLVWEGEFVAATTADYVFRLSPDDGARVILNGERLLEVDGIGPANAGRTKKARVRLAEGAHPIRVEYFEFEGQQALNLSWKLREDEGSWKFLSEPRGDGGGSKHPSIPVRPSPERAAIYRNFIADTTPRAIGIGFPGGVNFAYSADHLAPELAWTGRFMDGGRHWTGRGQGAEPPAGGRVVKLTNAPAFPEGARFRGYALDAAGNPTFKVSHEDRLVEDAYRASDGQLRRTLSVRGRGGPVVVAIAPTDGAKMIREDVVGGRQSARLELRDALLLDVSAPSLKRDGGRISLALSPGESATLVYRWPSAE
jgi:mono/diheme cytochrome c family protein